MYETTGRSLFEFHLRPNDDITLIKSGYSGAQISVILQE